jgi:hypothetical protein
MVALPGDQDYPLWGWGADQATELTGTELTDAELTAAHRQVERALRRRVTDYAWYLDAVYDDQLAPALYPYLAGYPTRRAWVEAVSWQAAWRQAEPVQANAAPAVTSERLGDHAVTYGAAVSVGGVTLASEAHHALVAAGLLAATLTGYSR